jgi:ABC transport system ATP-binding/permease protein
MSLISARNLTLAYGGPPLLEGVDLQVAKGDRIGLIGRNGTGKSSLLALLAREIAPDSGVVEHRQGLRVARLPQEAPPGLTGTAAEVVTAGASTMTTSVAPYLDQLGVPADAAVATLSGGLLRRTLLGRALAAEPDVLFLDEPTNHLDLDVIEWLEQQLQRAASTLVFVTHDRALLRALATRIVELDRGRLLEFAGDYDAFLRHRDATLEAEAQQQVKFDRKLAEEEAWIRRGIKARRTRNEGRVRALMQMREERRQRRREPGTARLTLAEAGRSGRTVIEAEGVAFGYDDRPVIQGLSTTIVRGDRVGVIGPNGAGKTTLLKLLLGDLAPQEGSVRHGTNLQVLYYDQLREQLDLDRSVIDNLRIDGDKVMRGGRPQHVVSYLQDFLFTPDRARQPVSALSGGERNRLLLARLFTREANVLVLDEPTNDLDLETLDLLEELLADFQGTLLLVTHDRTLLDRTVTSTLAVHGDGRVTETIGGYREWRGKQRQTKPGAARSGPKREKPAASPDRPRKLTYREKEELAVLPGRIEALEAEQAELHERLADPEIYREGAKVAEMSARMTSIEVELEALLERWTELEDRAG